MSAETYDPRTHQTVRRGARGQSVVTLQKRLCTHFRDLSEDTFVDGDFGPLTEQQVRRFQRGQRLSVDGVVGRNTWSSLLNDPEEKIPSPAGRTATSPERRESQNKVGSRQGGGALADRVFRALRNKRHETFDDGQPYHLNIVGIRSPSTVIDHFDDRMIVIYRDDSGRQFADEYSITTDPGEYYTQHKLLNKDGAAILVPGQYRDAYRIDKHQGRYEALCQRGGTVKVWRDASRSGKLNRSGRIYEGWFGINIHRAGATGTTERVGRYSAGCQVFQRAEDFAVVMEQARKSKNIRGNKFTYTLIEEAELR
jgi:peptidoglycan hydrolase-like protein with peptidoglycan-binding domain